MQAKESENSAWVAQSQEIQTRVQHWRKAHPKATLREIETAIDAELGRLRAVLVEETAQASPRQEWQQAPPGERPCCATCGTPLLARGQHRRRLQAMGGTTIELERTYGSCPTCGQGLFPPG